MTTGHPVHMHQIASFVLGGFLVLASIAHAVVPARVEALVPEWWPHPRATIYLSGVVEMVCGLGVVFPETRPTAGLVAAVIFVTYTGVHADDLRHARTATSSFGSFGGVIARSLINLAYAGWAVYVALGN